VRRSSDRILLLAVSGLLAGLAYFVIAGRPSRIASAEPVAAAEREPAPSAPASVRLDAPASAPASVGLEPAAVEEIGSRSPEEVPAAVAGQATEPHSERFGGRLSIRAVDAASGKPLNRFRVRALGGARFADRESERGRSELELALSPDLYSLLVLSKGYEAAEPPPVRIEGGTTVRLDEVRLSAGSARIQGIVVGESPPDRELRIELTGEGRRPCEGCGTESDPSGWTREEPCSICGYSAKLTRRPVAPGGRFVFEGLASGPYALQLDDAHGIALDPPMRIELREAESLQLELEASAPRAVRVEIVDTDAVSLARVWAERMRAQPTDDSESTIVSFSEGTSRRPLEFACTVRHEGSILASATLTAPPLDPNSVGVSFGVARFGSRRLGVSAKRSLDDRQRTDRDGLRPEVPSPEVRPSTFAATVDEDGFARLEPLSSGALTLEMTCGRFSANVEVPASRATATVRARFKRTEPPTDSDAGQRTLREFEVDPRR
jgi:hypothetical protein